MNEGNSKYKKAILFIVIGFVSCFLCIQGINYARDLKNRWIKAQVDNVVKEKMRRNDSIDIRLSDQDTLLHHLLQTVSKLENNLDKQDEKTRSQFIKPKDKNTDYLNHWFDSANRASGIK